MDEVFVVALKLLYNVGWVQVFRAADLRVGITIEVMSRKIFLFNADGFTMKWFDIAALNFNPANMFARTNEAHFLFSLYTSISFPAPRQ